MAKIIEFDNIAGKLADESNVPITGRTVFCPACGYPQFARRPGHQAGPILWLDRQHRLRIDARQQYIYGSEYLGYVIADQG